MTPIAVVSPNVVSTTRKSTPTDGGEPNVTMADRPATTTRATESDTPKLVDGSPGKNDTDGDEKDGKSVTVNTSVDDSDNAADSRKNSDGSESVDDDSESLSSAPLAYPLFTLLAVVFIHR